MMLFERILSTSQILTLNLYQFFNLNLSICIAESKNESDETAAWQDKNDKDNYITINT